MLQFESQPTDDGAVFAIQTDDQSLQQRIKQAADTTTPTPEADTANADREGGPIRRISHSLGPLNLGTLEAIGLSGHEISDAIQTRVNELYRNKFPVLQPRFERTCPACPAEFDTTQETCPECGTQTRQPDATEKRRARQLLESVNKEGQSLRDLAKTCEWDQWLLGAPIIVIRYEYDLANGQIIHREPEELVKGDPKRLVPVVDENNRIGGYWWACPVCRGGDNYKPKMESGRCRDCGAQCREVFFAEFGTTRDDIETYYFREEILTFPWAFPRLHGLDGLSPIHHIWLKQVIIDFQDSYAGAFYDPESERMPNQMIVLHTTNPDAWESRLQQARENAKDDEYDTPVFANEYSPQNSSTPEVQVVDTMPDELLGQNESLKDTLKKDIRQAINISDVFDSDLEEAGGLNNEGLQIEVTDRSIASQQHDYVEGWLDTLGKRLGIEDWRITFIPSAGPDAKDLQQEIKAGEMADKAGLDARLQDGQVKIADGEFDAPEPQARPAPEEDSGLFSEDGETLGNLQQAETTLQKGFEHIVWADELTKAEPFWSGDESLPERVAEAVRDAIFEDDAIFDDIDGLDASTELKDFFADKLTQSQGWSLQSLIEGLREQFDISREKADDIARTESASVLNNARDDVIRDIDEQSDDDTLVKWLGPSDDRTTDLCKWLKEATDDGPGSMMQEYGKPTTVPIDALGDGVTMDQLEALEREAQAKFTDLDDFRRHVPHINCRHTFTQVFDP
jgi:hypothetical protein